jgi:hypothetical protein
MVDSKNYIIGPACGFAMRGSRLAKDGALIYFIYALLQAFMAGKARG